MVLQVAIGPVCLFIFQTGSTSGFALAETGVLGITIVDGLFILAAILGLASLMDRKNVKAVLRGFGAVILCVFGLSTILSAFDLSILPSLSLPSQPGSTSIFLRAMLLTLSNPLTVLFWAGAFSAKIAEEELQKSDMLAYGFGAVLSTLVFLTLIAWLGSVLQTFLSASAIQILNVLVGVFLIFFGMRMMFRKG
ncbi:LysE family transporter [Gorillibacterium timonense]|uniref:LysE family transporter n=1 Tax=Gorillibacterium timonense TaxID=1689269 RepID=UPI0018FE2E39|nr:LysE family transporter [Gorillibacterium timonense]